MQHEIIEHQPAQAPAAINSPAKLLEIAVSKDMDIEKLERLLALQERWDSEQARKSYLDAFSKFQAECPEIPKNIHKKIPYKSGGGVKELHYADLGQISKYVRPAMEKHGLSFRWEQQQSDGLIKITCIMSHRDGHSEQTSLFSNPDTSGGKGGLHSIMSTVTYLKRYTLSCLAGLSTVDSDDDGVAGDSVHAPAHASVHASVHQPAQQAQQPTYYPDDKFQKNFASWSQLISSGKQSADTLIKMAASKGQPLSPNQIGALKSIK